MSTQDQLEPKDVLNNLYEKLQSEDDAAILSAIEELSSLSYSSEAIRRQLETLAIQSNHHDIRENAFNLLNSAPNRAVQQRIHTNKLGRSTRKTILQEIEEWTKHNLLAKHNADVIRRRYDFDIAPQTPPNPVEITQTESTPKAEAPAPVAAPRPQVPQEPRPSLLQTLTSEASIKVYLYLGAFFVIAAAAILGAAVPELRLPILIIGTLIFGGLAISIKKRLPQPSFALFIVFSFLLVITANSLEETLRASFHLTQTFSHLYWTFVFLLMAGVWGGSTWLYESQLFSVTSFGALIFATLRLGNVFDTEPVLHTALLGLTALAGLGGTQLLKKWKDAKFALPLFVAAQVLQAVNMVASLSIFGADNVFTSSSQPLWNLAHIVTWILGAGFYLLSNALYPFVIFPWLTAAALIPLPWFVNTGFQLNDLGSAITLFIWGFILAAMSEPISRFEKFTKYALPLLLASLPGFALAVAFGFSHETWLGLILAFGSALLFTTLHILNTRWWLWVLALFNFIIAHFAFFQLETIKAYDVFAGYQVILLAVALLSPDLFLKKDWAHSPQWRLPLRIFGALFTLYLSFALFAQNEEAHIAICFAILTFFFTAYALAWKNAHIAYLPAAYLSLTLVYMLDALHASTVINNAWLPVLTALAIFYYLAGIFLRHTDAWGTMFRNSGMALAAIVSFTVLINTTETGGWYTLVLGTLFIAEMYLRKNGWFEAGAPILFSIGVHLVLKDFHVTRSIYHLLAHSLVWILADLLAHLTFSNPRPLRYAVRAIGGLLAAINYISLFNQRDAGMAAAIFGIYTLLFLTVSLLYRQPNLFYTFTLTLPLFAAFLLRAFEITKWIHPVIVLAMLYYAAGTVLRWTNRAKGWDESLLYSGLGIGVIVSIAAPILGGVDASIPVAIAATLWAFEAFSKRNAWLAFPANGLYLLAYFIILAELNVDEPQFFSMGAALFGLIQHYLLTRAESKTGTFMMGMISQFILLGTTYIEMINKDSLGYFFLLFAQSLVVLVYGIIIRSRSLTFFPIGFVVLGVITVVYSTLKDVGAIFVIGCTGILLLLLGVGAVLLRERIAKLGEKLSDWQA